MNSVTHLSLLFFVLSYTCNSLNPQNADTLFADGEDPDPGTPLFLTPLIENGKIIEARTKALVRHREMGDVASYSGYLTVNKEYNSNLFFWFFPAFITINHVPVVLSLQGGPDKTSMFGLFSEHGPFIVTYEYTLKRRLNTLSYDHNVIYIDSPVGVGYSFTDNEKGYARNVTQVARDLHTALVQFFLLFPELQNNDFFVTGESYAGKYVAAVAHAIKENNIKAKTKINLKGLSIGNGFCDPENQVLHSDYFYQIGLIDLNGKTEIQKYEETMREFIKQKNFAKALQYDSLFGDDNRFTELTGFDFPFYNYINANINNNKNYHGIWLFREWIQRNDVRYAIHVGKNTFDPANGTVVTYQKEDLFESVVPLLIDLLEHYRVLIYNGQMDIFHAYPLAANYLQKMKWSGAEKYAKAPRNSWAVENELAGWKTIADNLTFVLVRNAGFHVFIDQPKWALTLINRFTYNKEI